MRITRAGAVLGIVVGGVLLAGGTATAAHLITGAQIRDRSIAIRDLAISARPKAGIRGPVGPAGVAGPAGGLSAVTSVLSAPVAYGPATNDASTVGSARAECPAGSTLVGGGFQNVAGGGTSLFNTIAYNAPAGPNVWGVVVANQDLTEGDEPVAVAQCATGTAPRATVRSVDSGAADRFAETLASIRSRAK